jgi:hypothetical protein
MGPVGCLSCDTEFLSQNGWKRIDSWEPGDMVAQWRGGLLEMVHPKGYIQEPCDELIWFRNEHSLSMLLSEEHRVPLYDWEGKFVVKTAKRVEAHPSKHVVPVNFTLTGNGPGWFGISQKEADVILDECTYWDGLAEHEELRYYSANKQDADFVQFVAHACGRRAHIAADPGKPGWRTSYVVQITNKESVKSKVMVRGDATEISRVPSQDGYKYCFSVPSTFFLARHDNKVFVTGNSGKSTACCWEIFKRATMQKPDPRDGIRRTKWAIIRNTYRQLEDTTLQTWLEWFPDGTIGKLNRQRMTYSIRYGDVEAEALFRALDKPGDIGKLLSLNITGGWINEAREVPKAILDALGDRVARYPSIRPEDDYGPSWSGIIMDTNPPDDDHWWYNLAEVEKPSGYRFFRQPGGLLEFNGKFYPNPRAENIKHLERNYYLVRMAGKPLSHVRVYYCGQYGFLVDGRPIYPEYVDAVHCAKEPIPPVSGLPLYVGNDYGLTPAATIAQRMSNGRWVILDELVSENLGAIDFAKYLGRKLREDFAGMEIAAITGDPAGDTRSEVDKRTPFQVLRAAGIPVLPAPTNDFVVRREAVAGALTRMVDGLPGLIISPKCKTLRKGMAGGYCRKRVQVSGEERYRDMPDKEGIYSHVCESLQYLLLGAGEGNQVLTGAHQETGAGFRPRRRR